MENRLEQVGREFFARRPELVARQLLGKVLVRRAGRKLLAGRIVETEAYLGAADLAAHAAAGNTPRTSVLFGPPGHAYVYFTYGMHYCMNVSCEPEGKAGCVLLRALEPLAGIEAMAEARGVELSEPPTQPELKLLCAGPARLCQALSIERESDNGRDLCADGARLSICDDGFRVTRGGIEVTERIGISRARELPLRFAVKGSRFLSR